VTDLFTEQALLLGPAKSLVGVITEPSPDVRRPDAPLFVILNAGIIHRVGPNRMTVILARALGREGFRVLRFDLSGIGDSERRTDHLSLLDAALADIRSVLDTIETAQKLKRVVLIGLCSGADHSIIYAGSDPRIVGVALLDPALPRTTGYYLRHYGPRMLKVRPWLNLVARGRAYWRSVGRGGTIAPVAEGTESQRRPLERPEVRAFLEQAYARAVSQGVHVLAVFTGGLPRRHNHSRQLHEAFPSVSFGRQLRLEYFSESDHEFSAEAQRARLVDLITGWARATSFSSTTT
jgi:pimeloyl-ACP methyl ester carboxylesterase